MILCEYIHLYIINLNDPESVARYDMYAGESRAASVVPNDPNSPYESQNPKGESSPGPEQGPALELIEMANGETIW